MNEYWICNIKSLTILMDMQYAKLDTGYYPTQKLGSENSGFDTRSVRKKIGKNRNREVYGVGGGSR